DLVDGRGLRDVVLRCGRRPLLRRRLAVDGGDLGLGLLVDLLLLEHRILRELLVDERFELRARDLEDLDGLTQLRRHDQLLRHPQLLHETGFSHREVDSGGCYRRNFSPRYISRARRLLAMCAGDPSSSTSPSLTMYARSQIPRVSRTL